MCYYGSTHNIGLAKRCPIWSFFKKDSLTALITSLDGLVFRNKVFLIVFTMFAVSCLAGAIRSLIFD